MIAFSTDASVAAPGVYLLSFLIETYVDRIVQYSVSSGKKSFAIMAPQNDYGNVATDRFQQTAAGVNAQIVVTARYSAGQMATAAQQVAAVQGQVAAHAAQSAHTDFHCARFSPPSSARRGNLPTA